MIYSLSHSGEAEMMIVKFCRLQIRRLNARVAALEATVATLQGDKEELQTKLTQRDADELQRYYEVRDRDLLSNVQ